MQNIIQINATNLPDLFFQTVFKAIEVGQDFTIDRGSYSGQVRKEFDFVVLHSRCPHLGGILPKLNPSLNIPDPVDANYLDGYVPYLMTAAEKSGEAYTYGQRLAAAPTPIVTSSGFDNECHEIKEVNTLVDGIRIIENLPFHLVNQIEMMIWTYKNKGHRNNQMILQVGQPDDILLTDPPCLRHIDTRVQDGQLHFYPYFRSWDLWGGLPANLAAIETLRQYAAAEIGLEKGGEIIASSKGLH